MKAKVEIDFDTISLITLELEGETIEAICEQVDSLENKVIKWGEENFTDRPTSLVGRIAQLFSGETHRERKWNPKTQVKEYLEKPLG